MNTLVLLASILALLFFKETCTATGKTHSPFLYSPLNMSLSKDPASPR